MAWGIDDQEAWQLQFEVSHARLHDVNVLLQIVRREVGGTNLLSDTASFVSLHISLAQLVENQCLACVDVTHDTDDGAAQLGGFFAFLSLFALSEKL